jgi:iron complex transport system ATP-binding protein
MTGLEVANLSVDLARRRVVEGVSLAVSAGEVVGLVGCNGSGKTTLLRGALGLIRSASGESRIGGEPVGALTLQERAKRVGYLPQERIVGWNLPAWRVAALGVPLRPPAAARRVALEALDRAGAAHLADRGVLDLSGGERARVLLARLLATEAPLLILDEPIAGLDPAAQIHTLDILSAHAADGGAVLATLHDLRAAARHCDRVVVLAQGRVIAAAPAREVFTSRVLSEGFGLTAMPS